MGLMWKGTEARILAFYSCQFLVQVGLCIPLLEKFVKFINKGLDGSHVEGYRGKNSCIFQISLEIIVKDNVPDQKGSRSSSSDREGLNKNILLSNLHIIICSLSKVKLSEFVQIFKVKVSKKNNNPFQ